MAIYTTKPPCAPFFNFGAVPPTNPKNRHQGRPVPDTTAIVQDYVKSITKRWRKQVEDVFKIGRELEHAAYKLGKDYKELFGKGRLPFDETVAKKLRRIANMPKIGVVAITLSWLVLIIPIVLFGAVLYPSRRASPKLGEKGSDEA